MIFPILFAPTQWCGWPGVVKGVKIGLKDNMCCDMHKEIDQNKMVLFPSSLRAGDIPVHIVQML